MFLTDYYSKCCLVRNKNGIDFLEKHQNKESPRLSSSDEFQVSRKKIKYFLTALSSVSLKEKEQNRSQNESMDHWSKPLRFFFSIFLTT